MNITDERGRHIPNKQESGGFSDDKTPSSSRLWSGNYKNPRIVRVSKLFGGKDRHSKVTTVRGLRDRRVRLSVPTAIQLYDLQDRLGLGQPSKVVDWLLNAAQHEIDKLPPLQVPEGGFIQPSVENEACSARNKQREISNDREDIAEGDHEAANQDSSTFPYASYYHWDPSNSYYSNLSRNTTTSEAEVPAIVHNSNSNTSLIMPLMPGYHQLLFHSSGIAAPSTTPSYMDLLQDASKRQQQFDYLQMASSMLQNMHPVAHSGSPSMRFFHSEIESKNYNSESQNGD